MAMAATVAESTQIDPGLTAIPEDQQPWRPGQNKHGPKSKRFGAQEATDEERQAFMERSAGLSTDDWQRSILYVYQWAPSVDLTRGGRDPKYRKIFTRHMSEEDLKRDLGSGTYELKLNQINPKGQEKTVDRLVISILDFDFPPNLPPGPWLDDPKNADWIWAKPLLEAKYKKPSQENGRSGSGPTWGEMIQFMREERRPDQPNAKDQLMSSVISILPALLQQQNSAQDPGKVIEAMARVKELIAQPAAPPPPAPDNTMLQFVLGQLTRLQESNDKLVQALLAQKSEAVKQPDPISQVETMAKLIATVSGIVQPAAPKEPWIETIETLGPGVINALDKFATGMVMQNQMKNATNPQRPQQVRPMPQGQQPNPAQVVTVEAQPAGNQPPPPAPPVVATAAPGEPEMDTGTRSILYQIAVLAANALNLGMEGEQFADQICYKFGQAIYDQFISTMPKESLLDKFKSIPEAWQVIQPFEPQLPSFIDSFYAYATQDEPEEPKSISQPEPVIPKKKTTKKK